MKKIISIIITICLLFSLATTALAANSTQVDEPLMKYNGHGQFTISKDVADKTTSITTTSDIDNLKCGDVIRAKATEDKEIYHIIYDKYLSLAYGDTYVMADKIDIDTSDIGVNEANFKKYNVSSNIIENIKAEISKEEANGNKDFAVAIFAPSIIKTSTLQLSQNSNVFQSSPITFSLNGGQRITTETAYYDYCNSGTWFSMQDYKTKYWHASTHMLENKTENAKDIANAFFNLTISSIGTISQIVSIFGVGISALSVYQTLYGPVVYGQQGDFVTTNTIYDIIHKETSVYFNGEWEQGSYTYKVWLDRADVYQFYGWTGDSDLQKKSINTVFYSEHYNDNEWAILNAPCEQFDFPIRLQICGYNVVL